MKLEETNLSSEQRFSGRVFNVYVDRVRLPDGSEAEREVVEHNGGVAVLAVNDNNEIYFVRQYRYPAGMVMLELPAGKLEIGEDPLEAGKRELKEETGLTAKKFTSLGVMYPTAAYNKEIIHIFMAQGLTQGNQKLDEGEFLTVEKIHIDEAKRLLMAGEITDAKTAVGLARMLLNISK